MSTMPVTSKKNAAAPAINTQISSQMPAQMPRGGVVSLAIKDKAGLYAAYMPLIANGAVFVPSNKPYKLEEEVYLLLRLLDNPQKIPVTGKIVWHTPDGTENKTPGIGVQLPDNETGRSLKQTIENILGSALRSHRATQTI